MSHAVPVKLNKHALPPTVVAKMGSFQTSARSVDGVLKAAARLIRKVGWMQGDSWDNKTGAVDVWGAINIVVGEDDPFLFFDAISELRKRLGLDERNTVPQWNDAKGRTVEEVLAALEGRKETPLS